MKKIADLNCEMSVGYADGMLSIMFKKKTPNVVIGDMEQINIGMSTVVSPKDFDRAVERGLDRFLNNISLHNN